MRVRDGLGVGGGVVCMILLDEVYIMVQDATHEVYGGQSWIYGVFGSSFSLGCSSTAHQCGL